MAVFQPKLNLLAESVSETKAFFTGFENASSTCTLTRLFRSPTAAAMGLTLDGSLAKAIDAALPARTVNVREVACTAPDDAISWYVPAWATDRSVNLA